MSSKPSSCSKCNKLCKPDHETISCDICKNQIHLKCTKFSNKKFTSLSLSTIIYYCQICIDDVLPFSCISDVEFSKNFQFKPALDLTPNNNNAKYILCGDYNINLLSNDSFVSDYLNTLLSLGCNQYVNNPTRISNNKTYISHTLLDHIYSNINSQKIQCQTIDNDISDHQPVLVRLNCNVTNDNNVVLTRRDMRKFDKTKFLTDLQQEMNSLSNHYFTNIDNLVNEFLNKYENTINKHAPLIKIKKKDQKLQSKPWITSELFKLIKRKNRLFKSYIKQKTEESRIIYKTVRNKLTHLLNMSKRNYYKNLFSTSKSDPKALWKNIEKIIKFKKPKSTNINLIEHEDKLITSPEEIVNTFNNYFVNVGNNLSKSLPVNNNLSCPTELIDNNKNSLFLQPITHAELYNLIHKLDINKATPSNCSSIKFIKISCNVIIPVLSYIFNRCLSEGTFPHSLKIAEVIPIYKSGSKLFTSNHRPISKLSPFSKLFEKCLYNRINNFFTTNKLLYNFQFGFRNNSSTENAVLQLYNDLLEKLSN